MADDSRKAVVLLSGGLDSTTVLAIARARGFVCHALSFDYGQRHRLELQAAGRVAASLGATEHVVFPLALSRFGGSALTDGAIEVPKDRDESAMSAEIPVTYVPARNTVFLSVAMAWAEAIGASDLFVGVNAVDYSGYPDCRPEFLEAFRRTANLATKAGVEGSVGDDGPWRIHAPLVEMSKAEIIREGRRLGVDYGLTWSCYDPTPTGEPCGRCDSCVLRARGFAEADAS
ncbi:MAG: 7-cyano-7-deazaguanine synthase QueC [Planctomycetota bacterium]